MAIRGQRSLKIMKNTLNKDVKDTYYSNKPLAVNHRKFIYYTCFKKHLNKVLTEALIGNNNEKV